MFRPENVGNDKRLGGGFGGGSGLEAKQRQIKQEAAAQKALELDPNLAEAYVALARIKRDKWEWQEAERAIRKAFELNPNKAHGVFANYLSLMGRHDEALSEVKRALELDPLDFLTIEGVGSAYLRARRYDEAIAAFKKRIELENPGSLVPHLRLGEAYAAKGMYREAIAEYQLAINLTTRGARSVEALLGAAYVKAGERAKAEEILQKLKARGDDNPPTELAVLYDALGMRDEAFAVLEKAYAERRRGLPFIAREPNYDSLRTDPRFTNLLRRMGLPQ